MTLAMDATERSTRPPLPIAPADARPPTRILMSVDAVGGVWRYAMTLGRKLAARGTEVNFIGFGPKPEADQKAEAYRIGQLYWSEQPLDWMADGPAALSGVPHCISEVAERSGATLLHLNLPSQAAGLETELPVLVASHSCLPTWFHAMRKDGGLPPNFAWHRDLNLAGLSRAHAVAVPSASHGEALRRVYGPLSDLHVIHNGLAHSVAVGRRQRFVLAAARWWDEGKNGAILDRAAEKTMWPIVMAGAIEGPDGTGIAFNHAIPRGALPYGQTMALMALAPVFASPSRYEPFGLAALEAASCGSALVLSDIATYRELWDGAALFAEPEDPEAFAAAINRLIGHTTFRGKLARQARSRSRNLCADLQADAMADLYRLLSEKASGHRKVS